MTNFERAASSPQEFVELFDNTAACTCLPIPGRPSPDISCEDCLLEWLDEEYKE